MDYSAKNKFEIDGKIVGHGEPCYIIAEIGINHNGDLVLAKKLIDAAISSGVDAVKFQKRDLESIYQNEILNDPSLDSQGTEILIDVLNDVEFKENDFNEIINYCKEKKITFLCTPWDIKSVDFLEKFKVSAYKIASADLTNFPLIEHISKFNKPMIISTGMSTMEEIEKTVDFVTNHNSTFTLLHCNSTYPSPIDSLNLSLIPVLQEKFNIPIGYSGHESILLPSILAANMGAVIIERHITLDKTMEGLDQSVSLTPDEFSLLIKYIRESEKAIGTTEKKMTRGEVLQREILGKSIVASSHIEIGEIISENNIEIKGPAKGLSPQHYYKILGKKVVKKIKKYEYINLENLE